MLDLPLPLSAFDLPLMIRLLSLIVFLGTLSDLSFADDQLLDASQSAEVIDRLLEDSWKAAEIEPAGVCSDESFVRRIYLDLAGRIPTADETRTFLGDQRTDKRAQLIDLLLESEDHVQHFADVFDALLMGRGTDRQYAERKQHHWRQWLERAFRENRPWNRVVQDILVARPESPEEQGAVWFLYERKDNHQAIAEAVAPTVFGVRIDCAQCHDHMMADEIEQKYYWGLVAFFNRGKNISTKNGPRVSESAVGGFSEFANLSGSSSPNLLTFLESPVIAESRPAADAKPEDSDELYRPAELEGDPRVPVFSRREQFVKQIVATHPRVARAFVNRMWALLLGRGIVHPFNEMDSMHAPSHPELLDWLADDFRQSDYNVRRLVRMLVLCRSYHLEARAPDGATDPATFAWYLERPLIAEQLARSIQLAVRGQFRNDDKLVPLVRQKIPDVLPTTVSTPVGEALFLTNNESLNRFLAESNEPDHLVPRLAMISDVDSRVTEMFQTIYSREPDPDELQTVAAYLQASSDSDSADEPRDRLHEIVWAMLMSAEFRLNH